MKLYFVRHGESEHNKAGFITGHTNSLLTQEGIEQAKRTALELPQDFTEIYCSDLSRCKKTADILNEKMNLPITYDVRLRERYFGSLEEKPWEKVTHEEREIDKHQKYNYHEYGGESVEDVKQRLFSFIDEMRAKKGKILIVTHGGIIRLLHHLLKGEVPEKIHNASLHEFEF